MNTTPSTLIGYFGGIAQTGASYEIELTEHSGTYTASAYSAAAGAARVPQGTLYSGSDLKNAKAKLLAQAKKKFFGRERAYNQPMHATVLAGQTSPALPGKLVEDDLPMHPQLWVAGRDVQLLPPAKRAQVAATGKAGAGVPVVAPVAEATAAPLPHVVMLCDAVDGVEEAEALLRDPAWGAMRKVEGRRAQIHVLDGQIVMTSRTGRVAECPPHIAEQVQKLPAGTRLDGELVAVDEQGREALFVGAKAAKTIYVAYDLLASPAMPDGMNTPQLARTTMLAAIIEGLGEQDAVLCALLATTEAEKRTMLAQAQADGWEGLIFRRLRAAYVGARSEAWLKLKLLRQEFDVIVTGYEDGAGRNTGTVGAVNVAMFDRDPREGGATLISIGQVGSGFTDGDRTRLAALRARGESGFVLVVSAEGFSAAGQLIRPTFVSFRDADDKAAAECILPATHLARAAQQRAIAA